MAKSGDIRIGISGWRYKGWRGVFYPKDLTQKRELEFAARQFRSIEINGTFYSLQTPESFASWAAVTPPDFVFAVKGPRYITHLKRLNDPEQPLANFFASGVLCLGKKLGPLLWQFPPNFQFEPSAQRLKAFLKLLPSDTKQAAALARRHDKWMKSRVYTQPGALNPIRHALEIRHKSFATKPFIDLLRAHNIALVCADTVEWPRLMDVTSDFVYCRLHGSKVLYASGYNKKAIDEWAHRVVAWSTGRDPKDAQLIAPSAKTKPRPRNVYLYFDNDAKVRAPVDAKTLIACVARLL